MGGLTREGERGAAEERGARQAESEAGRGSACKNERGRGERYN